MYKEADLIKQLDEYSEGYYKGKAVISDAAFDAMEEELRAINPNSEYFKRNRETAKGYGTKHPHIYSFIGSIDKIHSLTESKLLNKSITVSAKLDGTSMVAYYKEGNLVHALTRGDGYTGLDATQHYKEIVNKYHLLVPPSFTGAIRGEVIFSTQGWEMFRSIHPEAKLPRNSGTGLVNQKTVQAEDSILDFVAYDLVASNTIAGNLFDFLESMGFRTAPHVSDVKQLTEKELENLYNTWSKLYPLDGLVIRENTSQEDFGKGIWQYKSAQEAFKFTAETKICEVAGITWSIGRTGKFIPVIQIVPTELSGAVVTNITGHNAKTILESKINVGATIAVRRSGEVIPYLDSVITPVEAELPTVCPWCKKVLVWSDTKVDLLCPNDDCEGKQNLKISNYILTMCSDIKGIGDAFLEGFLQYFNPTNILDLLSKLFIYDGSTISTLGKANNIIATKVIDRLTNSTQDVASFLKALGISLLGGTFSEAIAKSDSISYLINAIAGNQPEEVKNIILKILPGRIVLAETVSQNTALISPILDLFVKFGVLFNITTKRAQSDNQTRLYAVTGSLSKPRKEFTEELSAKGWKMTETISKAEVLINNDNSSSSSKNIKAREAGKPILTEEEFRTANNL